MSKLVPAAKNGRTKRLLDVDDSELLEYMGNIGKINQWRRVIKYHGDFTLFRLLAN